MPNPIWTAVAVALLTLAAIPAAARSGTQPPPQTHKQVEDEIWGKERAIYAARARGDLGPYIASVARDYRAWPPFRTAPAGVEGLNQLQTTMAVQTRERLDMRFVSLSLNGDAAVIYYATHRTMLPDGTPVDERFDVIHSWVREDGAWKVLGGMARERKP